MSTTRSLTTGRPGKGATDIPKIRNRLGTPFEPGAARKKKSKDKSNSPLDVVLATNTSSISITAIAATVEVAAPRVIGMHFFNPVPVMKLIEVIRGLETTDTVTAITMDLAKQLGKTPIAANDRAGFVSNRVLMPMINEAFYAWMEGVALPADIDEIMKLGCNFPMGPLRLADFTSLDVRANRRVPTRRGELNWFVEISNLLNHANYCCLDYRYSPASVAGPASLTLERDALLGVVPNIGVRWEF